MQEKQARAQLMDDKLFASLSHLDKADPSSHPSLINLADHVNFELSTTDAEPPRGDRPASSCSGDGWVFFAGVWSARCTDPDSDAISQISPSVSTSGRIITTSSAVSKLCESELT